MTYAALTAELDTLLHELEHNTELPLDELSQKVQRAYALIAEGRQHLYAAEESVTQVMNEVGPAGDFEEDGEEEEADAPAENSDDE